MSGENIVLHINAWVVAVSAVGGVGFLVWVIWLLLKKLSTMTIDGVYHKIDDCQKELHNKIAAVHTHATNAHKRVGRIEETLLHHGVKSLKNKSG